MVVQEDVNGPLFNDLTILIGGDIDEATLTIMETNEKRGYQAKETNQQLLLGYMLKAVAVLVDLVDFYG